MNPLAAFAASHHSEYREEPLSDGSLRQYVHSKDNSKRYALLERWDTNPRLLLWVMFNPGTGEIEGRRRRTLDRCRRWSKEWGYGGLLVGNVHASRSRGARELNQVPCARDDANVAALRLLRDLAAETIVAWGSCAKRDDSILPLLHMLSPVKCLGATAQGYPRHPLYVSSSVKPCNYNPC
jgi:hypothetical protein